MRIEDYDQAIEIKDQIVDWVNYRSALKSKIEYTSEVTIAYGDTFTLIRDRKVEISELLIKQLNILVGKQIYLLKNEFENL